ncbi:MAG: cyclic nucleotide-binding domain-containing protein [Pseudomonadota bacterium]
MDADVSSIAFLIIGYLGLLSFVVGYALLQFSIITGSGAAYVLLNLLAALLLMLSHVHSFNATALITQSIWGVLSLVGLGRILIQHRGLHFSPEETALREAYFSTLSLPAVRRVFDAGVWNDFAADAVLLQEGAPVDQLFALVKGGAEARVGGVRVGDIDHGLIGEINVLSGQDASATVQVSEPSRAFVISGPVLRNLVQNDSDLELALQKELHRETGRKLVALNFSK